MVNPLDPNMPKDTLAAHFSLFTKGLNDIIDELNQSPSPPWDDIVSKIQALIQSNPDLGPRALNLLNQAIEQLKSENPSMLPCAIQSLDGIGNDVTLSQGQVSELQYIIDEIKNSQPPYTQQIQDLNAFLNSKPPLSTYEKDCVNNAIQQLEAGGTPDGAIVSLNSLQSQCTLSPEQLQKLEDIIDNMQSGSPPFTKEVEAIKELLNSQPPISPYERDCLNKALSQLQAGNMTQAAIGSLQNLLPM